jgi:hypothetical protein
MNAELKVKTVAVTRTVPVQANSLWTILRGGGDVDRILPEVIQSCRVEGVGPGARRFCTTKQGPLEETILCVNDDARLFRYRIDRQSMMPVDAYEGSVHVADLGKDGAEVLWFATYRLVDEEADSAVRDGLAGLFHAAIQGMVALAKAA